MAVVDSECRVIGVDGLRVVDSSIFPRIPNGNLNGPSIMVGEKAPITFWANSPCQKTIEPPGLIRGGKYQTGSPLAWQESQA